MGQENQSKEILIAFGEDDVKMLVEMLNWIKELLRILESDASNAPPSPRKEAYGDD